MEAISISASHRQAAEAILDVTLADTYSQTIDQIITMQLKRNPALKNAEPEMRAFLSKYMSLDALRPELSAMYAREFSEPELREIIKFYRTPLGQKTLARMPQMMLASMEISQRLLKEHLSELQQIIREKSATDK